MPVPYSVRTGDRLPGLLRAVIGEYFRVVGGRVELRLRTLRCLQDKLPFSHNLAFCITETSRHQQIPEVLLCEIHEPVWLAFPHSALAPHNVVVPGQQLSNRGRLYHTPPRVCAVLAQCPPGRYAGTSLSSVSALIGAVSMIQYFGKSGWFRTCSACDKWRRS